MASVNITKTLTNPSFNSYYSDVDTLGYDDAVLLYGSQTISGNKTFTDSINLTDANDNLSVSGTSILNSVTINGGLTLYGNLSATGSTVTLGDASSDVLTVNSTTTLKNNVTLGDASTDTITINGNSTFNGANHFKYVMNPSGAGFSESLGNGCLLGVNRVVGSGTNTLACSSINTGGFEIVNFDTSNAYLNRPAYFGKDGSSTFNTTTINGDATIGLSSSNSLVVNSNSTFNGSMSLLGNSTLGNASSDTLIVESATTLKNNVIIGDTSTDSLTINSSGSITAPMRFNYVMNPSGTAYTDSGIGNGCVIGVNRILGSGTSTLACSSISTGGFEIINLDTTNKAFLNRPAYFGKDGSSTFNSTTVSNLTATGTLTLPSSSITDSSLSSNVALKDADNIFTKSLIVGSGATISPVSGRLYCYNGINVLGGSITLPNQSVADSALSTNVCFASNLNILPQGLIVGSGNVVSPVEGRIYGNNGISIVGGTVTLPNNSISNSALQSSVITTSTSNPSFNGLTANGSAILTSGYKHILGGVADHLTNSTFGTDIHCEIGTDNHFRMYGKRAISTSLATGFTTYSGQQLLFSTEEIGSKSGIPANLTTAFTDSRSMITSYLDKLHLNGLEVNGLITCKAITASVSLKVNGSLSVQSINNVDTVQLNYISNLTGDAQEQFDDIVIVNNTQNDRLGVIEGSYATQTYVQTQIADLVDSAPSTLNTLNELSVALGNDPNFATTFTTLIGTKAPLENPTFTGTVSGITKSMVSLGSVDNTADVDKPISTAQQTALDLKAPLESPTFTGIVSGITKSMVSLGSVDNTADTDKPISTAQQTALDLKAPLESPTFTGTVSGITKSMVSLGSVDNTSDADKPVSTAQQNALDSKAPLTSPTFTGTVSGITKSMVSLGSVDNTSDADKPVSTAQQTALDLKSPLESPALTGTPTCPTAINSTNTTQVASTAYVKSVIADLINTAPANLDTLSEIATQLANDQDTVSALITTVSTKAVDSSVVHNTGAETIAGIKTFSDAPVLSGASITSGTIPQSSVSGLTTAIQYLDATSSVQTQLNSKATDSGLVHTTGSETIAGVKTFSSAPVMSGASITSSTIAVGSINANLQTTDTAQTISAIKTHNVETIIGGLSETIGTATVTTNACSINYTAQANQIYYVTPSSATNFSLTITNMPLASYKSVNFSLIINSATYKQYANAITINGTSRTLVYINGSANIPALTSATSILQSFNVIMTASSTVPFAVYTSVTPVY